MTTRLLTLFFAAIVLISCTDEKGRAIAQAKDAKKKEKVFESINSHWKFNTAPTNATSQDLVKNWADWRNLLHEMSQKPQSSISAFQKKAKILSQRVADLPKRIPFQYNKPEVKARIAVLTTKINSLNLYINLDDIPAEKVNTLVTDINLEMQGFQNQLGEIVRKSAIPKEQGEADMIRMLDTSRAVPTNPSAENKPMMPPREVPRRNGGLLSREHKLP
ncbi:MAG: hypothetical protein EOO50_01410 [Flavobacterium sp.]|uniref:hypothetical protein n=1 Tax=Flavobacterium sp. TaxID=239 RepID=UPI00120D1821|nr:hypothetical protein [Flavobacterium sp.]RZJ68477.1 MAG: hypothetical protein EOO50_01410 [Flavobacterium sp.]